MKISINLLPPEIIEGELKGKSFYKIQFIGIAIILTMVFLASLSVALRILQSNNITVAQEQLTQTQERLVDLKGTQESLLLLKNRLAVISKYLGVSSNQPLMYKLLESLIPSSVVMNAITVDKSGGAILLATVPDSLILDDLINNLTQKDNNEGKISQVSIENLSRGRDGFYRISLKIKP